MLSAELAKRLRDAGVDACGVTDDGEEWWISLCSLLRKIEDNDFAWSLHCDTAKPSRFISEHTPGYIFTYRVWYNTKGDKVLRYAPTVEQLERGEVANSPEDAVALALLEIVGGE